MIPSFEFASAGRIVFGNGCLVRLPELIRDWGKRPLIVTGSGPRHHEVMERILGQTTRTAEWAVIATEPTVEVVSETARVAREKGCDHVIACGGGSVIDAGKAISALLTNTDDVYNYLEIIGRNQPLPHRPAHFAAIPTTAGTGAEVTRNAVLKSAAHQLKVSLRSPLMLPTLALVDPTLTYSLPPGLTACTGLDALTQVLEPYVSCRANPLTDSLCRMGLEKVGFGLRTAYYQGDNPGARETMSLVSLWGGLALANAGLGAVHGFAGPLGGMYSAPHGAVCASLLAPVWQANVERLRRETPRHPALDRYQNAARWLTGNSEATVEDGSRWLVELVRELEIPPLSHWGVHAAEIPEIATKSAHTSSMKGNPIGLTLAELETVLSAALD